MARRKQVAAESVAAGHPDKVADYIADSLVDAALDQNPDARVAAEVLVTGSTAVISGEVSGVTLDYQGITKGAIVDVGYGSLWEPQIQVLVQEQSSSLRDAAAKGEAADQTVVYGYACDETEALLPRAVVEAHRGCKRMVGYETSGPDGKTLVVDGEELCVYLSAHCPDEIGPALRQYLETAHRYDIFHQGGPAADTGVTGRKTQVDTYGSIAHHGGGGFSGKDPSKLDRSGAYMARFLARYLVEREGLPEAEVMLAYHFGQRKPALVTVNGMAGFLAASLVKRFDLTPGAIVERLGLRRPIYAELCNYGHFGKPEAPWEAE